MIHKQLTGGGKRESPIEFLRIIAILMVITLHYSGQYGKIEASKVFEGGYIITRGIWMLCISAVDIFLIISGYFSIYSQKRKLGKPITLMSMVVFYYTLQFFVSCIINHSFNFYGLFYTLLPTDYFVNIFCALYIISPYINKMLLSISRRNLNLLMITLIVCFCLWPMFSNIILKHFWGNRIIGVYPVSWSGTEGGYNIVNFSLCYIIGAYIRITNKKIWDCQFYRIMFICALVVATTFLVICFPCLNPEDKYSPVGGLCSYDSITTLALATSIFMLFRQMPTFHIGAINILASATFGVYLIHNKVFYWLSTFNFACMSDSDSLFVFVIDFFVVIAVTYMLSLIIYFFCECVATPIRRIWKRSKLYNATNYIE